MSYLRRRQARREGRDNEEKTINHPVTSVKVGRHDLDCDLSVQGQVVPKIDRSHPALPQLAEYFILPGIRPTYFFEHRVVL